MDLYKHQYLTIVKTAFVNYEVLPHKKEKK